MKKKEGKRSMASIILYGSCYGTSRRYAETLSSETGIPCLPFTRQKDPAAYDRVIYIGGLYMGNVLGLTRTARRLSPAQRLTVFTVGLSDTRNAQAAGRIRMAVRNQLPAGLRASAEVYHLSGGIDYARLSFAHRAIIDAVMLKLRRVPESERGVSAQTLLDAGRTQPDFAEAIRQSAAHLIPTPA